MKVRGNIGNTTQGGEDNLILIVDDNESDTTLLQRSIKEAGVLSPTKVLHSGAEAISYLTHEGAFAAAQRFPFPRVVFLDLKMPPPDGLSVLKWKESQPKLPNALWVAVSILGSPQTIDDAYRAGANTFLAKPVTSQDLLNLMMAFGEYWMAFGEYWMAFGEYWTPLNSGEASTARS